MNFSFKLESQGFGDAVPDRRLEAVPDERRSPSSPLRGLPVGVGVRPRPPRGRSVKSVPSSKTVFGLFWNSPHAEVKTLRELSAATAAESLI